MSEKRKVSEDEPSDKEDIAVFVKQPKLCEAGSSTSDYEEFAHVKMNPKYLRKDFIAEFRAHWNKEMPIKEKNLQLYNSPFSLCTMKDFIFDKDPLIDKLIQEMCTIEFDRRQMDLYEFYQTTDLVNYRLPGLSGFYKYLKTIVMPWMEQLTGIQLTHISASVSMYNCGDYLLVHDDLMTDRKIAFVYYLSPWKGVECWTPEMGGALELFSNEYREPYFPVTFKVPPENNQLIFFKVCRNSFHQVGEVTNFDYPRLTINGWFHGPASVEFVPKIPSFHMIYRNPSNIDEDLLSKLINPIYLKAESKEDIHKQIEDNSEASLEEFLDEDFYDQILTQIQQLSNNCWIRKGPANLRNYEVLEEYNLPKAIMQFRDIFVSKQFFKLLHELTELDLDGSHAEAPKCFIEIQRWTQGSYTVLGDPSQYADCTLDIIFYINAYPQVGIVTYLSPEEEPAEDEIEEEEEIDPVLLTIHPKDNALNIVYRSEGTTKFTKYVSKNCLKEGKYSYILSCRYTE